MLVASLRTAAGDQASTLAVSAALRAVPQHKQAALGALQIGAAMPLSKLTPIVDRHGMSAVTQEGLDDPKWKLHSAG